LMFTNKKYLLVLLEKLYQQNLYINV